MAQTTAQRNRARARDRARLGDGEYKRIVRDKMRAYRSSYRSWAYTGENFISPSASKKLSPA